MVRFFSRRVLVWDRLVIYQLKNVRKNKNKNRNGSSLPGFFKVFFFAICLAFFSLAFFSFSDHGTTDANRAHIRWTCQQRCNQFTGLIAGHMAQHCQYPSDTVPSSIQFLVRYLEQSPSWLCTALPLPSHPAFLTMDHDRYHWSQEIQLLNG